MRLRSNDFLLCLPISIFALLVGCGSPTSPQGKEDQSAAYTKLQNANYVVSQMNALNTRVQNSKTISQAGKNSAANALSYAKSLVQEVQNDYYTESSKTETDPVSSSRNSYDSNADDWRAQSLVQQVRSAAQSAISYASGAGIKTSDVDPSPYLRVVEQP